MLVVTSLLGSCSIYSLVCNLYTLSLCVCFCYVRSNLRNNTTLELGNCRLSLSDFPGKLYYTKKRNDVDTSNRIGLIEIISLKSYLIKY